MKNIFKRVQHQLRNDIISMSHFPFTQDAFLLELVLIHMHGGQMAFPVLKEKVCCNIAERKNISHFTCEDALCCPWVDDERQAPSAELLMHRCPKLSNCSSGW